VGEALTVYWTEIEDIWYGIRSPTSEAIRNAYQMLNRKAEEVFPCCYASAITIKGDPIAGTLNGFMHYASFKDETVVEVK
jgi:hypothetical protein